MRWALGVMNKLRHTGIDNLARAPSARCDGADLLCAPPQYTPGQLKFTGARDKPYVRSNSDNTPPGVNSREAFRAVWTHYSTTVPPRSPVALRPPQSPDLAVELKKLLKIFKKLLKNFFNKVSVYIFWNKRFGKIFKEKIILKQHNFLNEKVLEQNFKSKVV